MGASLRLTRYRHPTKRDIGPCGDPLPQVILFTRYCSGPLHGKSLPVPLNLGGFPSHQSLPSDALKPSMIVWCPRMSLTRRICAWVPLDRLAAAVEFRNRVAKTDLDDVTLLDTISPMFPREARDQVCRNVRSL